MSDKVKDNKETIEDNSSKDEKNEDLIAMGSSDTDRTDYKKSSVSKRKIRTGHLAWDKLDNTANLFPVPYHYPYYFLF